MYKAINNYYDNRATSYPGHHNLFHGRFMFFAEKHTLGTRLYYNNGAIDSILHHVLYKLAPSLVPMQAFSPIRRSGERG